MSAREAVKIPPFREGEHRLWLFTTAPRGGRELPSASLLQGGSPAPTSQGGVHLKEKYIRQKPIPLTFRVTKQDEEIIRQNAKSAGMNLTDYLTACAVGKNIVHIDGLNEFTRTLKRQGTNLNQLVTLANMGRIQSVNVSDTYELLLDIHKLLKKILERKV